MSEFIHSDGLYWPGVLKGIKKAANPLQPVFEVLTNSLEAIDMRTKRGDSFAPCIIIDVFYNVNTENMPDGLAEIHVSDNGIGFDDENYSRLKVFKDDTKGYSNRGSGRIQLIKSFSSAKYHSVYLQAGKKHSREFVLSQGVQYLQNNTITQLVSENDVDESEEIGTKVELVTLSDRKDIKYYNDLDINSFKQNIIDHYILYLCLKRDVLPQITINYYHINRLISSLKIEREDIPTPSKDDVSIFVPICHMSEDMKRIESSDNKIDIKIKSYKIPADNISKNAIKVTSKNEVIDSVNIKIDCLPSDKIIEGSRFLFLLSSEYFDNQIGDTRDNFDILNKTEFKKKAKSQGYIEDQIVLDDLTEQVKNAATSLYEEIARQEEVQKQLIQELKSTYLLSEEALSEASLNDSPEEIVRKAYAYDAKIIANNDISIKTSIEQLKGLNPIEETYQNDLEKMVTDLTSKLTFQGKESLSRYVTHRKLVIELLRQILDSKLKCQNIDGNRNVDEKLIHNLLFRQHSNSPENSDLWMLNEEYLYFKGVSESRLNQIEIDGKKLFRPAIEEEEARYLKSLGENRPANRPDILLFPAERKCIIIELKTPNTNLATHLNQINKYAYFIRNFSSDEFIIDTFYGYLIGESLEPRDVRAYDGDFKYDPNLNMCFRPSKTIPDDTSNHDGSLYTEVLQYSVVLERAQKRNEVFIKKLFEPTTTDLEENDINKLNNLDNKEIATASLFDSEESSD